MNLHVHDTISKICTLKQSHPDTKDNISEKQSYSEVRNVCEKVHAKVTFNKMAQVGIISKAQKQQKDFKMSKCSLLQYLKNPKRWTELARRGPFRIFIIHCCKTSKS